MRSNVSKFYNIKSLRELRSVQRDNEAAKTAAARRVRGGILKLFSLEYWFSIETLLEIMKSWS